jgi:hypothetical protein
MTDILDLGNTAWRDYEIDGVPSSGAHRPGKTEVRAFVAAVNRSVAAIGVVTSPPIVGGVLDLDLSVSDSFIVANTADVTTVNLQNVPAGLASSFILDLVGDGTQRAWTWPATWQFPVGGEPTLSATDGAHDMITVMTLDGTHFRAFTIAQGFLE